MVDTSNTEIDRFPVADLPARYGIKSAALYKRFDSLGIKPLKSGRTSHVTGAQLAVMDDLHQHLKRGGGLSDFVSPDWIADNSTESDTSEGLVHQTTGREVDINPRQTADRSFSFSFGLRDLLNLNVGDMLTSALVNAGKMLFPPPLPPARRGLQLAYLRELRDAAEEGWLLTNTDVAALLGVSKSTIASKGQTFSSGGFVFTRAGRGLGGQIAWRVAKAPRPVDEG